VLYGERAGGLSVNSEPGCDEFIHAVSHILKACYSSLMVNSKVQSFLNTKLWREHKKAWDTAVQYSE